MKKMLSCILLLCLLLTGCARKEVPESVTIKPLKSEATADTFKNSVTHIAFHSGDAYADYTGYNWLCVTAYEQELYDADEIRDLKVGDILIAQGIGITVKDVYFSESGRVKINGGSRDGGITLYPGNNETFFQSDDSGTLFYQELATVTVPVSDSFVFYDLYLVGGTVQFFDNLLGDSANDLDFAPNDTLLTISNGEAVSLIHGNQS